MWARNKIGKFCHKAPNSSNSNNAFNVNSTGLVYDDGVGNGYNSARPVAYLKSSILLSSVGDGSSTSPYQLSVK